MKMFLNGQPADASDGATIEVTNPANGSLIETIPSATEDDIKAAITDSIKVSVASYEGKVKLLEMKGE